MRLLFVHADHLEFETTTEAGEGRGETEGVPTAGRMEDCVTAFVTVESGDEADLGGVVANAADELRDATDRLNARKVVLYPCTHLSDDPADSEHARIALRGLEAALRDDFEVLCAPVGWYKAFEIASRGHPLAEFSRRVTPEREAEGGADDDRAPSEWKLLFPDGEARDPCDPRDATDDDRVSADLRALIEAEGAGKTASEGEQFSHVEPLREQGFAASDESGEGDSGPLRWYPRGKLVRDALAAYANDLAVEYGATPVETPAADARGPLSLTRDADLAERDAPLRLYEVAERPEIHAACADLDQAREELRAQAELVLRAGADLGLDYRPAIRATREFYEGNEAWVENLVEDFDRPALLEIRPERRDRVFEVDFVADGRLGESTETPSVRLDAESTERFDVADADGEPNRHAPVLRCSPVGSLDRAIAALLETAAKQETPRLPTWLAPTQVRFVPVGDEHVEYCDALVADLESSEIRADVDDRHETVGERLVRTEADWVPYYAVVGDRELDSEDDLLAVTVRGADGHGERELTAAELRETVREEVGDRPTTRRYLPKRVSRRPDFTGR